MLEPPVAVELVPDARVLVLCCTPAEKIRTKDDVNERRAGGAPGFGIISTSEKESDQNLRWILGLPLVVWGRSWVGNGVGDKEEDHGATKPCALLGQSGDLSRLREHRGPLAAAASTPHLLSREHASSLTATASQSQQNSNFDGNAFGIRTLDSLLAGLPVSFLGWPAGRDEKREEEEDGDRS